MAALWVLLLATAATAATVRVQVSGRSIADDDDLQVTFSFQGQGEAQLPNLRAEWSTVGQQQGTNIQIINGRMSKELTYTLVLRPKHSGKLTIGAASLVSRGQVLARSRPVQVVVRGVAALKPSEATDPKSLGYSSLLLVPEFARDHYYVGEPIVAEWVLYVERGTRISLPEIEELELPDAIQAEDVLPADKLQEDGKPRKFFGRTYSRVPVKRQVWKVLRATPQLTVPSLRINVPIRGRGMFGQSKRLKSTPLLLSVGEVPTAGRPAEYREGTVGTFALEARVEPDESGARALLRVTVGGEGSLDTLDPPDVSKVSGATVKALPSDDQDELTVDGEGMHGTRVFQFLLTPERAGTVFVPALTLHYFDPESGTFRTARSKPATWTASKGVASTRKSAVHAIGNEPEAVAFHPIESESELVTVEKAPVHSRQWFVIAIGLPFLLWLGLEGRQIVLRRSAAQSGKVRAKRAHGRASKALHKAERLLQSGDLGAFHGELARVLRGFVQDKKGLVLVGMTNDAMRAALGRAGYSKALSEKLVAELENCDFARFAPALAADSDAQETLQRARTILGQLEEQNG